MIIFDVDRVKNDLARIQSKHDYYSGIANELYRFKNGRECPKDNVLYYKCLNISFRLTLIEISIRHVLEVYAVREDDNYGLEFILYTIAGNGNRYAQGVINKSRVKQGQPVYDFNKNEERRSVINE